MRKIFNRAAILIMLVLPFSSTFGQSGWVTKNPLPQANDLESVEMVSSLTGISVGASGTVVRTFDGGSTWDIEHIEPVADNNFTDVFFINDNTGWILSRSGKILHTTNFGENWINQTSGLNTTLNEICFVNPYTGWIVGNSGKILKTTNGGNNWFNLISPTGVNLYSAYFLNYNTGWICGGGFSNVIKTTNGGMNWYHINPPAISEPNSIFFINENTGWICGNSGRIAKTTNGGNNWNVIIGYSNVVYSEIKFVSENVGWIVGGYNTRSLILITANGGESWITREFNGSGDLRSIDIDNVPFLAVGQHGIIYKSMDGQNWNRNNSFYDNLVKFQINGTEIFALSSNSKVYNSVNNGEYFGSFIDNQIYSAGAFYLLNNKIWISGRKSVPIPPYYTELRGVVIFSSDNGANFDHYLNYWDIHDIIFLDSTRGWAVGKNYISGDGVICRSYGGSFTEHYTSGQDPFYCINFSSYMTGWASSKYVLSKTTNAGDNWFNVTSFDNEMSSVFFIDDTTGWICTKTGKIGKSISGGNTWQSQYNYVYDKLNCISFINRDTGYCVGENGRILYTTNSGLNWNPQNSYTNKNLKEIYFTNSDTGYIIGDGGVILKTISGGTVVINNISYQTPTSFSLYQNYPNPFNPSTKIKFDIPKGSLVKLKVFDILGREVAELVNEKLNAGVYEYEWNGAGLTSGVYFYRLEAGEFTETKRMVLLK